MPEENNNIEELDIEVLAEQKLQDEANADAHPDEMDNENSIEGIEE